MTPGPLLLISLSNIGDAIMTTPVLESLHSLFPDVSVDIVADRRSSQVFERCPYLGKILFKDKHRVLRGLLPLLRDLRATEYALMVDLRTDFLPLLLRARRRFWKWSGKVYGPHTVERHLGVIAALHGDRPLPQTAVWVGAEEMNFAAEALSALDGRKLIALGPGANWPPKIWPAASFAALIVGVANDFDGVILLGDARDERHANLLAGGPLPCVNLCGRTSLLQAAALLRRAAVFVGNDSGLGHLASAVGTPSLTLFGPGDPVRYRPWGCRAVWVTARDGVLGNLSPGLVLEKLQAHLQRVDAIGSHRGDTSE